jgi:hypothetical protein
MRLTLAFCAAWSVLTLGCALTHERPEPIPPAVDAALLLDAPENDVFVEVDAGPPSSCDERWRSLPWCPADPASQLGQPCATEGLRCGTQCCEPGAPIECRGGVWVSTTPPECRGVDCAAPVPCGAGACAPGRVCVNPSSEVPAPLRCVEPPFPATSCGEVPSEWLATDPRTCSLCLCAGAPGQLEISLECACCDR